MRFRSFSLNSIHSLLFCLIAIGFLSFSNVANSNEKQPEQAAEETPAKYLLRFKFTPNQKVTYKINNENTRTLRKGELQEITYDKSEAIKHFVVQSVAEDGSAKLESMIDQVKLTARFNNEGEPIVYDSTTTDKPPRVFKKVKETIGIPLAETTFSTRGSILKTKNLIPNADTAKPKEDAKTEINKDDPSRNFLMQFPEEPISLDDRWSFTFKINNLQVARKLTKSAKMKMEYRLKEVEGDIATITFKTTMLSLIRDPKVLTQLLERMPNGVINFDMKRGIIVKRTSQLDKTEFGFSGSDSSMRAVSSREETLTGIETVASVSKESSKIKPVKAERIVPTPEEETSQNSALDN